MAGFGGAVKLTGESEYRRALSQITQSLRVVSSEMRATATSFDSGDKSTKDLASASSQLSKALDTQKSALSSLKSQLATMTSEYNKTKSSHDALVQKYDEEKTKLDQIGKTLGTSSTEYKNQAKVVEGLSQEVAKSTKQVDAQGKALNDMKIKTANAETTVNKTAKAIDELGKEAEESGKQAEKGGDGFTIYKGILADLGSKAIQSAISGLKRLGGAILDVGKQSYNLYAQNEQLVGGVETLFGESADKLIEYANNAYKTAGVSANEYMEQATSFSATLLQGLGGDTAKAVEYANLAITDMSDNANKMGTDMTMIQNAYQGFAKDNYTMLDNLKLGYGGTQSEMARLINDSGVLGNAVKVTAETVKDVPFDKIIEAIHKTQQQIGITGTTTLEAKKTIEGSTKAVKASWENLMVAIASENGDLSKSLKEFTDGVVILFQNSVPRIKQIMSGMWTAIVQLGKKYAPEMTYTIVPIMEKIGTVAKTMGKFVVENFQGIASTVMIAVSAFTAFNAVMAVTKTINTVTTAIQGLEAGIGMATKAQAIWNAVMTANPIGAVIAGVTALIAVVAVLATTLKSDVAKAHEEEMNALKQQSEAIEHNVDSWNNLKDAQQESVDAGMSQMSHYQMLYDELQNIVDANGRVKEGYEERASFITSQLKDALGVEISLVDGVIQNYGELQGEIDKTMEKKKAQIILDSQESLYKEAITKQTQALKELNEMQDIVSLKKIDINNLEEQMTELANQRAGAFTQEQVKYYDMQMVKLQENIDAKKEELSETESNYNTQKDLLSEYAYNISLYENNMALAHAGKYSEMSTVNWEYVKDYQNADDAQKAMLEQQVKTTETNLNLLKELKAKSGSDMYDSQIQANEKLLQEQKDSLNKYISATTSGMSGAQIVFKDGLDKQLSDLTGAKVEFKKGSDGLVQMYVNGVKEGKPKSEQEMSALITATINKISEQETGAKTAGENLIDGVNDGVANERKQSGVFSTIANFGSKLLGKLKDSLKEQSPSKATREMGQFLLEGLGLGIKAEERDTIRQVQSVGKHVIEALDSELNRGANIGEIAVSGNIRGTNQSSNQSNLVGAFKEALSQMKIEMNDEEMGRFVDKTVTRLVYT